MNPQTLAGKVGVVFGVANKRSIAWAIARAWAAAGARLIFNYQGERLKDNVEELVGDLHDILGDCGGPEQQVPRQYRAVLRDVDSPASVPAARSSRHPVDPGLQLLLLAVLSFYGTASALLPGRGAGTRGCRCR